MTNFKELFTTMLYMNTRVAHRDDFDPQPHTEHKLLLKPFLCSLPACHSTITTASLSLSPHWSRSGYMRRQAEVQEGYFQHRQGSEARPQCTPALSRGSAPEGIQHVTRAGRETLVSCPSGKTLEPQDLVGLCNKGHSAVTGTAKTPQGIFRVQS